MYIYIYNLQCIYVYIKYRDSSPIPGHQPKAPQNGISSPYYSTGVGTPPKDYTKPRQTTQSPRNSIQSPNRLYIQSPKTHYETPQKTCKAKRY